VGFFSALRDQIYKINMPLQVSGSRHNSVGIVTTLREWTSE